jgi:MFS family permease
LLNLYLLRLGYGPEFAGVINGVGQVAFGICALPAGLLGRAWGSRRLLIVGLSMMAVGFGLLPLAEFSPVGSSAWLIATQCIGQVGICLYFVNGAPFVTTVTAPAERNHVFAASLALLPLAAFFGSLIGGLLPAMFGGWLQTTPTQPAPYQFSLIIAALLMLPAVGAMLATRPRPVLPQQIVPTHRQPAPVMVMAILSATVLLRVIGEGAIRTFLNIYLDSALEMPVPQIGLLLACGQLLAIPASLLMPLLAERWGNGRIYVYSSWAIAVSFIPMALVPHWAAAGLGYLGTTTFLAVARPALVAFQMAAVSTDWRTLMAGATTAAVGLGWAVASLSGGFIITSSGYPALFIFSAVMTALAAVVFRAYFGARPVNIVPLD